MTQGSDFVRELGVSALGTRLRRLFERLNGPVSDMYRTELGFEQRWFALTLALERRGPCAVKDAAQMLGTSHVSVLQVARAMEGQGLLKKSSSETDRRSTYLALTEEGRAVAARLEPLSKRVDRAAQELLRTTAPGFLAALDAIDEALAERPFGERLRDAKAENNEAPNS